MLRKTTLFATLFLAIAAQVADAATVPTLKWRSATVSAARANKIVVSIPPARNTARGDSLLVMVSVGGKIPDRGTGSRHRLAAILRVASPAVNVGGPADWTKLRSCGGAGGAGQLEVWRKYETASEPPGTGYAFSINGEQTRLAATLYDFDGINRWFPVDQASCVKVNLATASGPVSLPALEVYPPSNAQPGTTADLYVVGAMTSVGQQSFTASPPLRQVTYDSNGSYGATYLGQRGPLGINLREVPVQTLTWPTPADAVVLAFALEPAGAPVPSGAATGGTGASTTESRVRAGAYLYVDAERGSDANHGSSMHPFRTIMKAVSTIQHAMTTTYSSGAKICINQGTYREQINLSDPAWAPYSGPIVISASGSSNCKGSAAVGSVIINGTVPYRGPAPRRGADGTYTLHDVATTGYVGSNYVASGVCNSCSVGNGSGKISSGMCDSIESSSPNQCLLSRGEELIVNNTPLVEVLPWNATNQTGADASITKGGRELAFTHSRTFSVGEPITIIGAGHAGTNLVTSLTTGGTKSSFLVADAAGTSVSAAMWYAPLGPQNFTVTADSTDPATSNGTVKFVLPSQQSTVDAIYVQNPAIASYANMGTVNYTFEGRLLTTPERGIHNLVVRGISFDYGYPIDDGEVSVIGGSNVNIVFDRDIFDHSNWAGLQCADCRNLSITDSKFNNNGENGVSGYRWKNFLLNEDDFSGNNLKAGPTGFTGWDAAGIKIVRGHNGTIRNVSSNNNQAHGIWLDFDASNVLVQNVHACSLPYAMYNSYQTRSNGFVDEANEGPILLESSFLCGLNPRDGPNGTYKSVTAVGGGEWNNPIDFGGQDAPRYVNNWETHDVYWLSPYHWTFLHDVFIASGANVQVLNTTLTSAFTVAFTPTVTADHNMWCQPDNRTPFGLPEPYNASTFAQWKATIGRGQETHSTHACPGVTSLPK